jgi:hypothetical protein
VAPYVLAQLPAATRALGVEVVVDTSGTAEVAYVNAIGPSGSPGAAPAPLTAG